MANWVTYLWLNMNPNSAPPTEIVKHLTNIGWKPVYGDYDFAYEWDGNWHPSNPNTYWQHINKVHQVLQTLNVSYSFRTYEKGKENGWVWWNK